MEILKIHAGPIRKTGEIDYEAVVKLSEGFNGADLRNVCTEAGMFAIRDDRDYCVQDDFMKGARKLQEAKKHESTMECECGREGEGNRYSRTALTACSCCCCRRCGVNELDTIVETGAASRRAVGAATEAIRHELVRFAQSFSRQLLAKLRGRTLLELDRPSNLGEESLLAKRSLNESGSAGCRPGACRASATEPPTTTISNPQLSSFNSNPPSPTCHRKVSSTRVARLTKGWADLNDADLLVRLVRCLPRPPLTGDVNNAGVESSDFPILCETCLGPNP